MVKACIKLLITGIILLIVGIIGVLVLAVNGYDDVFSLPVRPHSYSTNIEVVDNGYYYDDDGEFSILDMKYADTVNKLDINVNMGNFTILPGENLSISGYNIMLECLNYNIENGCLSVTYSPEFSLFHWNFNFDFDDAIIIITVPQKRFESASFSVKAGELCVSDFEAEKITISYAAGNSSFSNVSASESTQIKMTAGDCYFENCSFCNANIKMTAGSMYCTACKIIGSNNITMTAGDLYMELLGRRSDYEIAVDRTAGGVYIDGNYISSGEYAYSATTYETTVLTEVTITGQNNSDNVERENSVQEKVAKIGKNTLDIKITAGECNILFFENE